MSAKLKIANLSKVFGDKPDIVFGMAREGLHPKEIFERTGQMLAVSDVSFDVNEGEIFTIMGLSGSGKSTLVRCLNRLVEPTSGTVLLDGEDICGASPARLRDIRRHKLSMVFQNFALLPHKSVRQNVEFGLLIRDEPAVERRRRAESAIEQVGLTPWADRFPDSLSGGMKQRVGLARALASDADIMLMDEPFSALDPLIRTDLQAELIRIQKAIKKTIIFITHDFYEAVKLSDKVAIMRDGRCVQVASPEEIVLSPADGYVRDFAKELDPARVISARTMARFGGAAVDPDASPDDVLAAMRAAGKSCLIVADEIGAPQGYICRADLDSLARSSGARARDFCNGASVRVVPETMPLIDVYSVMGDGLPVAVVDAKRRIVGTFDAGDVLSRLSTSAHSHQRAV
ncbi:MAG: glycine betaine/L-proline ABC transporter ATP-binding protein [Alphaproteobacteria bacterium]|nr:glycine betaine/L-proline ABC transporter ATP-binding protein [Alphaproteobacteria bacterium]